MEWYKIAIDIFLALGGLAGIGALVKVFLFVKQDKKGKEIDNKTREVSSLLNIIERLENHQKEQDERHRKELEERDRRDREYRDEVYKQSAIYMGKYEHIESRVDSMERVLSGAYRCPYPPTIKDCPVVKEWENVHACEECKRRGADECIECKE
jgi:hypothetical protein